MVWGQGREIYRLAFASMILSLSISLSPPPPPFPSLSLAPFVIFPLSMLSRSLSLSLSLLAWLHPSFSLGRSRFRSLAIPLCPGFEQCR